MTTTTNPTATIDLYDRAAFIKALRTALRTRSGCDWSVRGGTGTAYGWVTIVAPPKRCDEFGRMTEADCELLASLLGKSRVSAQGDSIPDSIDYRREYLDRAAGIAPAVVGRPYWD